MGSNQTCSLSDLRIKGKPAAEAESTTLLRVTHSSLNYKDALSAAGNKGVTRSFPHTPGIDAAGTLVEGEASALVTGFLLAVDGQFFILMRVDFSARKMKFVITLILINPNMSKQTILHDSTSPSFRKRRVSTT